MLHFLVLVVGFLLLVWGANRFVEGASALASKLGIPSLIIGLTVVAFGTSAPELAVSVTASLQNANEIVIGNVLGSNIFNILIVAGVSAIITPLIVEKQLLNRDWIVSILGSILLTALVFLDKTISRFDGLLLLIGFSIIIGMQIFSALDAKKAKKIEDIQVKSNMKNYKVFLNIALGLTAIVLGGQLSVDSATEIARIFNISETIIGLTIVAIGTSLPEFVTSIVATKKGEKSIAIGNVIGSNIFNILFILGISAVVNPINVAQTAIFDNFLLLLISSVYFIFAKQNRFGRKVGISMVSIYLIYTIYIILR